MTPEQIATEIKMDWTQVVLNGGPPCFAVLDDEPGWYCGRAERWEGHDGEHEFISLAKAIQQARDEGKIEGIADTWKAAIEIVQERRLSGSTDLREIISEFKSAQASGVEEKQDGK